MKIRLNRFEVKLSSGRKKIYDLLKDGGIIKPNGKNYQFINKEGIVFNEVKNSSQMWTIELMKLDMLLLFNKDSSLSLNPKIEEIK